MNVAKLKRRIAAYLQVEQSGLIIDGEDLLLGALNNAQVAAQRDYDFHECESRVSWLVGSTGVNWKTAVDYYDGVTVRNVRAFDAYYLELADATLWPLEGVGQREDMIRQYERNYYGGHRGVRHRADHDAERTFQKLRVVRQGQMLRLAPWSEERTVVADVFHWLDELVEDTDENFLTEYGADWLMWKGVEEANHLIEAFVPRQEGSLGPPADAIGKAWGSLMNWDTRVRCDRLPTIKR